jgi:Family of unknown function (DUF6879)
VSGLFARLQRSAWRLEVQPFYQPDADEFGRYMHGLGPTAQQRVQRQRWVDEVAAATAAGRQIGRVLVIAQPVTPYWQWRLETARAHVAAGEDIRVAVADGGQPGSRTLDRDFWLLDDELVRYVDYAPAGRFLGVTDTREAAAVSVARSLRTLAVAGSVPLEEFLQVAR